MNVINHSRSGCWGCEFRSFHNKGKKFYNLCNNENSYNYLKQVFITDVCDKFVERKKSPLNKLLFYKSIECVIKTTPQLYNVGDFVKFIHHSNNILEGSILSVSTKYFLDKDTLIVSSKHKYGIKTINAKKRLVYIDEVNIKEKINYYNLF